MERPRDARKAIADVKDRLRPLHAAYENKKKVRQGIPANKIYTYKFLKTRHEINETKNIPT
jgi:hypothetical protein